MKKKPLMGRRSRWLYLIAAMASGSYSTYAFAEEKPSQPASGEQQEGGLSDIIVTASKREQNAQREAISITALSADALATRAITDPGQLAGLAPSVQFQPSFLLLTFIRGVGNYSSQPAVDQSIAFNVDGIYLDRPYAVPNLMFDLERVELLRGPQGTLQGRNSTGGSVNLVTRAPKHEFEASASLSGGNYGAFTTEAAINLPLADNLALRVSGGTARHDGYFDNGFGNQNVYGVRARLLYEPSSRLKILVTGEYSERDEKGPTSSPCPPGSGSECAGIPWRPFSGTPNQGDNDVDSIDEPQVLKAKNYAAYAEISYDLDFADLTWVPSYRFHTYRSNQAYSQSFGYAPAVRDGMHSQELRLSSKSGSNLEWVVGGYWGRQSAREQNYFLTAAAPSITVDEPGFERVTHVYFKNDVDRYIYRSQSVFGQVTVPLADGLRVTAGGRYTQDRKSLIGRSGLVVEGPTLITADIAAKQSIKKATYKVGVEYDFARQVMGYANLSTGFKAGGVNGVPSGSGLPATFAPEKITAYQAGVKSRFLDNRVQVNAEAFYYDYRGYQTSLFGVTPEGILIGLNTNSQKAELYGMEVETSFLITPDDRLDISGSLLHAKYKEFFIPSNGLNLSGKPMQNAPKQSFAVNYTHSFQLANGARIDAHGEVRYEGDQWVDYRLSAGSFVKGFFREGADVTYHAEGDRWTIGAFVRNISNNGSAVVSVAGLGPYPLAVPLPPRTYGVRASARF